MKKLFKSHPQQPTRDRDRDIELIADRPMSPFKAAPAPLAHTRERDSVDLDLAADLPASPLPPPTTHSTTHSTLRERDSGRDRSTTNKIFRNSSAGFPTTSSPGTPLDDNWELVEQTLSAPPPPSALRSYERARKLSLSGAGAGPLSPPLPNPHSPFAGQTASRQSSMNSVSQSIRERERERERDRDRDREREREHYPNPHLNAHGPGTATPPPPSPYSPTSPAANSNSSGGATPTGATGPSPAHGHAQGHALIGSVGTVRKKSLPLPLNPAQAQAKETSSAHGHGHGSVRGTSHGGGGGGGGGGTGGTAGTAAILRALDPTLGMFGGQGGVVHAHHAHSSSNKPPSLNSDKHSLSGGSNSDGAKGQQQQQHRDHYSKLSQQQQQQQQQAPQSQARSQQQQQYAQQLSATAVQQQQSQPEYRSRGRKSGVGGTGGEIMSGGKRQKSRPRSLSLEDREYSAANATARASFDNPSLGTGAGAGSGAGIDRDYYYVDAPARNHSLDLTAGDLHRDRDRDLGSGVEQNRRPSLALSTATDDDPTLMIDSSDADSVVHARANAWKERDAEMQLDEPQSSMRRKVKDDAAREREKDLAMARAFGSYPTPIRDNRENNIRDLKDRERDQREKEKEKPKSRGFLDRLLSEDGGGKEKEKEKDEKGGKRQWGLFSGSSAKDKDKERDRDRERPRNKLVRERERERDREPDATASTLSHTSFTISAPLEDRPATSAAGLVTGLGLGANATSSPGAPGGVKSADALARMVGLFVSPSFVAIDWTLALEICERTYASDNDAKEVARALRKEIKYARAGEQLGAATLWAIMLQNASDAFITQTAGRKFLDVVEDAITSPHAPAVRERLLEVLGAAVYLTAEKGGKEAAKRDGFRALWRKVKPEGYPSEGMPLSTDNPMFKSKTGAMVPEQENGNRQMRPPSAMHTSSDRRSPRTNGNGPAGVIPVEEDIRRLFQECRIGRGNATLLNEALAFASPSDLKEKDIIKEFYAKCRASQELIHTQIPWASAGAERSRVQKARDRDRDPRRKNDPTDGEGEPPTREEKLLAELLAANEELTEALRIYDEIERVGVENEVERNAKERSRVEVRGNAQDFYAAGEAPSFLTAPSSGTGASSSRSASPVSMNVPSQTSQTSHSQLSFHHDSPHQYLSHTPPPPSAQQQLQQREAQAMQTYQQYVAAYQHQQQHQHQQHQQQLQQQLQQLQQLQQPQPPASVQHSQHGHGALPPTPTMHAPANHSHTQLPLAPRPLHGPRSPATAVSAAAGGGMGVGPNISPQPYSNPHSRPSSPALGAPGSRPGSRLSHSRTSSYEPSALGNEVGNLGGGGNFDEQPTSLFVPGYETQMQQPPHLQHYDSGANFSAGGTATVAASYDQPQLQIPPGMSEKAAGKRRMADLPLPATPDAQGHRGFGMVDEQRDAAEDNYSTTEDGGRFLAPPDGDAGEYYSDEPGGDVGTGGGTDGGGINLDGEARPPPRWRSEPKYVYDAAAERTRERIRRGIVSGVGIMGVSPGIEIDPL